MSIKPENILADEVNETVINGIKVRKGTIGAALANAKILSSNASTEQEKDSAKKTIQELAPGMIALGLHEHVTWKNPEIQKIMEDNLSNNLPLYL